MIVDFSVSDVVPERRAVLQSLGIPPRATVPRHIEDLYQEGLQRFTETAAIDVVMNRAVLDDAPGKMGVQGIGRVANITVP